MRYLALSAETVAAVLLSSLGFQAWAAGPSIDDPVAVITNDSANDSNFATGLFIYFQAFNGVPTSNQTAPTITTSPFSSTTYGYVSTSSSANGCGVTATCESLFTRPEPTHPNTIAASVPYSSALSGPFWFHTSSTSNFSAGTDTLISTSGSLSGVGAVPFVGSLSITPGANPLTPTITWTAPTSTEIAAANSLTPNAVPTITQASVLVLDDSTLISRYNINPGATHAVVPYGTSFLQSPVEYNSPEITTSPTANSYTLPANNNNPNNVNEGSPVLQYDHTYTIGVSLQYSVGSPVANCQVCNVLSRSESFFDYTPIQPGSIPNLPLDAVINLPTTQPIPTTSGLFAGPVYSFHVDQVSQSSVTYIDPLAADGFIYQIGTGDPNFATVDPITDIGSGVYQLLVWDSTTSSFALVDSSLDAGQTFDFLTNGYANGVSEFEILGIDPGVDPTDVSAFITGLTFTGPGSFTGTMTPIVEATTPLPASWYLMMTGLFGLGLLACRRKRIGHRGDTALA